MNLATYTTAQLVAAFNAMTIQPIKKFENRQKAERRVSEKLADLGLPVEAIDSLLNGAVIQFVDGKALLSEASFVTAPAPQPEPPATEDFSDDDVPAFLKKNRVAQIAAVLPEPAPAEKPARKARETDVDFRNPGKVEEMMLDIISKIGPAKVGAFRKEWISRDPAGYGKLAPTQQKGIMRKAINRLVETGKVSRDGSVFSVPAIDARLAA